MEHQLEPVPTDITFFVPCLNEESNIIATLQKIKRASDRHQLKSEILVFDDASTDQTASVVENHLLGEPDPSIRLIKNKFVQGLGYNYAEGSYLAKGKYYMLVNGDNSEDDDALDAILSQLGKADMIIPYFDNLDNRRQLRKFLSKTFTRVVNFIGGHRLKYYNGPVLHLKNNVLRHHSDTHGFAYQAEIIVKLLDLDMTYIETKVVNKDRDINPRDIQEQIEDEADGADRQGRSKAFSTKNILSVAHSLFQIFLRRLRREIYGF